ncbi:MAG: DNA polymerase III subunit beta [bacterium]|nr:DNA polymerase III subunit beta [bacterium]
MNIIILKKNLHDALAIVEKASGENFNLPILKNILLETEGTRLKLVATNLEIAVTSYASAKIIEQGEITVPGATLGAIISNLPNERVTLETKGNALHLTSDTYKAILQGLPVDEFPIIPKLKAEEDWVECSSTVIKDALGQIISAAQVSDLRPEISGILFAISGMSFKLTGTDSFRLAEKTIGSAQFKTSLREGVRAIVPLKTAHELLRNLSEEKQVRIIFDDAQILFRTEDFSIISRLIDGTYPDYEAIVPKTTETEVELEREELMNALRLTGIFTSRVHEIKLSLKENKKTLEISSVDQTIGENQYLLAVKAKGEPVSVSFNWRYLLDGLKVLKGDVVLLGLNGDVKPAILRTLGDQSYFYVLMPIKNA